MIDDAVARIQAIEQTLTEKSLIQLQMRLAIRSCLKELRAISSQLELVAATADRAAER
jgi:spore coat polysaccharide biosynthesis protein SpsF (cytidylyltransferase family)